MLSLPTPGAPINFSTLTADAVADLVERTLAEQQATLDAADSPLTVLFGFAETDSAVARLGGVLLAGYVSADPQLRERCFELEGTIDGWLSTLALRPDLCAHLEALDLDALGVADRVLAGRIIDDMVRGGCKLDESSRDQLGSTLARIGDLCSEFFVNIERDASTLSVLRSDLSGVDTSLVDSLPPDPTDSARVLLSCDPFLVVAVLTQASNRKLRRDMAVAYNSVASSHNRVVFAELVDLRRTAARLLGEACWADVQLPTMMAGSTRAASEFLIEMLALTGPAMAFEQARIGELLEADGELLPVEHSDFHFYDARLAAVGGDWSLFFEWEATFDGLLRTAEDTFDLSCVRVPNRPGLWAGDLFTVAVSDRPSGGLLGVVVVDPFAREGKFPGAATWPISVAHSSADVDFGAEAAVILAIHQPEAGPTLLTHEATETLFHEFAHAIHMVCSRPVHARLAAQHMERDFIEAPAIMFAQAVWDPEVVAGLARHHVSGQPPSGEMLTALVARSRRHAASKFARQAALALLDLGVHSLSGTEPVTPARILGIEASAGRAAGSPFPAGSSPSSSFSHLAGGYDAGYFGYLWAQMVAFDCWAHIRKDPARGPLFRRSVLTPAATVPAAVLVKEFLGGRPASPDAWAEMAAGAS